MLGLSMARATAVEEQPLRELLQIGEKGPEASSLFWDGRSHIPRGNRKVPRKNRAVSPNAPKAYRGSGRTHHKIP